jgi:PleD family two-component response regulator
MAFLLCVDDEKSLHLLLRKILTDAGHEVLVTSSGAEAAAAMTERTPDLMLLDLEMPGESGLDIARRIKGNPFTSRVPILMLTAQSGIETKIEGFEAGADDFLAKPFHPRELIVRVESLLRLVAREGERNPSSGLPGGPSIERAITARRGSDFALVYVDLDHFKPFADAFGFSCADRVISGVGGLLGEAASRLGARGDIAGHIGGDDFLIVCESSRANALACAAVDGFSPVVEAVIGREAMEKGTFRARDRNDTMRQWPLARLTATVVCIGAHDEFSIQHLGSFAAGLKNRAKGRGTPIIAADYDSQT